MSIKIGHASIDENKRAHGGAAGDQTGKEVCTRLWYNRPWISVIRAKDSAAAEKIAMAMEQACANDNIGYDQYQRTTLYTQAKANNWDLSKITVKCECDCSSLVAVCVNAAGILVSKDIYTGNQKAALESTGKFDVYTASKYTGSASYLKRGDILLGDGHTAIVLENGANVKVEPKKSVSDVTKEVIQGKWGNGTARKQKLEAAGYNYYEVQNAVNALLSGNKKKSVEDIAKEVIQGKWGNGATRKQKLTEAGYDYNAVQKKVNELL